MADGTNLQQPTVVGDKYDTEDLGARGKVARSKIILGALGVDGGDITPTNALPARLCDATGFLATIPVSAAALPLPADAATEASLAAINAKTPALGSALSDVCSPVVIASDQAAIPISVAALPLPAGAATAARQDTEISALSLLVTQTDAIEGLLVSLDGKIVACNTGAVVIASSALPTGASTAANQATEIASLASLVTQTDGIEGLLSSIDAKITACDTSAVVVASSALPTGAATAVRQNTGNTSLASIAAEDFATEATLAALNGKVTTCNTGAVVVSSSALPLGAATETTLAALNTKVTACNTGAVVVSTLPATPAGTNRTGGTYTVCGQVIDENGAVLTVKVKSAVVASNGNNAFIAAVASKKIRILSYIIQARGTVVVKFFDTTPAQITNSPEFSFQDREGARAAAPSGAFEFESTSGLGVQINLSAAISVMAHVTYVEVP